jgi:hypothetical protein
MDLSDLKTALKAAINNSANCIHYRQDFNNKSVHNFKTHNTAQANLIIKALKKEDSSDIVEAKEWFNTLQSFV